MYQSELDEELENAYHVLAEKFVSVTILVWGKCYSTVSIMSDRVGIMWTLRLLILKGIR